MIKDNVHLYISEPDINGCRSWSRATNSEGRPNFVLNGKLKLVSRYLLELKLGRPLLQTELACHICDNNWCVSLDHLWVGTHQNNMDDKVAKGRQHKPSGVLHGRAKLSDEDILKIRNDTRFEKIIAKDYKVSKSLIGQIKRREIWDHL